MLGAGTGHDENSSNTYPKQDRLESLCNVLGHYAPSALSTGCVLPQTVQTWTVCPVLFMVVMILWLQVDTAMSVPPDERV